MPFYVFIVYVHESIEKMTCSYVFAFASKPNQTRAARTWSTWTLRLSWSQRTASHSQSSWWPPPGKRSLHGPVTSARHVNTHHSLQQSDEKPRMSAESLHVTELTNIPSVLSVYFSCVCPTVHRQHPLQWADDERLRRQLQSHSATDDQVSLIFLHASSQFSWCLFLICSNYLTFSEQVRFESVLR